MAFRQLFRATKNKYNRLLAILSLIYLFSPFLLDSLMGNMIVFFFFSIAIIIVVYQIKQSKWALKVYITLVALALLPRVTSYFLSRFSHFERFFELFNTLTFLTFIALSVYLILRELTFVEQVTADIIKGGICVYFLLGFFWADVYNIVYIFDASSFHVTSTTISRADLTYFSFTSLTTVGYGDITPMSETARVLANLEGMVGVMYPAVFIARLVSLHGNR